MRCFLRDKGGGDFCEKFEPVAREIPRKGSGEGFAVFLVPVLTLFYHEGPYLFIK